MSLVKSTRHKPASRPTGQLIIEILSLSSSSKRSYVIAMRILVAVVMSSKSVIQAKRAIVLILDWVSSRPQAHKLIAECGSLLKYTKKSWAWIKTHTELINQDFDYLASSFGLDVTGAEIELELMRLTVECKGYIQQYENILKESRWYLGRRSMFIQLIIDLRVVVKDCIKYRNILSTSSKLMGEAFVDHLKREMISRGISFPRGPRTMTYTLSTDDSEDESPPSSSTSDEESSTSGIRSILYKAIDAIESFLIVPNGVADFDPY